MKHLYKYSYFIIIPIILILFIYYYIYNFKKSFYHVIEFEPLNLQNRITIEAFEQSVFNILGESYGLMMKKYLSNEYLEKLYKTELNKILKNYNNTNKNLKFNLLLQNGLLPQQTNRNLSLIFISKELILNEAQFHADIILSEADKLSKQELISQIKSLINLFTKYNTSITSSKNHIESLISKLKLEYEIALKLGIKKPSIESLSVSSMEYYKFGSERILKAIESLEKEKEMKLNEDVEISRTDLLYNSFAQLNLEAEETKILNYNIFDMYYKKLPFNRHMLFIFYSSIVIIISLILTLYLYRFLKK